MDKARKQEMIYDEIAMNNGIIFQHTYDILNEKMNQAIMNLNNINKMDVLDASLFVPVVVNGSLACELLLKSMLPQNTRGHKLDELFLLLDNNIQENIKTYTINEMKKIISGYCDTDFQNDLAQNNDQFIEWRYFHEGNAQEANLQFISGFMKAIFSVVNEEREK